MNNNNNNLPKGWRKVRLGEIVENFDSKRIPLSSIQRAKMKGEYPYYGAAGIIDYINDYIFDGLYLLIAEDGTLTSNGDKPMLQLVKGKFWVNNHAHVIKGKDDLETMFLFYALSTISITPYITGAVQPKLTQENLNNIEILYPEDKKIRKEIVLILSAFDDKIELNNKIIKTLEEMAQEIFKEWFVRFRFPGWQKVKFVNSELGKIPEGWEVKKLGDILSLEYGKALTAPNRKAGNIPVYASSGIVGYHNEKLDNGPGIIVGRAGIPGSVYWSQTDFYCVDSAFYVKTTISKYFVYYLLKYQNLESLVSGSAVPGLNRNMVYLNLAVLPNIEIINKFEDFIKPVFLKIYNLKAENQTLAVLRDLLLPKLMSGEIRV
jgi:type I restriction enzyme S subunit